MKKFIKKVLKFTGITALILFVLLCVIAIFVPASPHDLENSIDISGTYQFQEIDGKDTITKCIVLYDDRTGVDIYSNSKDHTYSVLPIEWRISKNDVEFNWVKYSFENESFYPYNDTQYFTTDSTGICLNHYMNKDTKEILYTYDRIADVDSIYSKDMHNLLTATIKRIAMFSSDHYKFLAYELVKRYLKENMNDPGSFDCIDYDVYYDADTNKYTVYIKFRGKNMFGAKVIQEFKDNVSATTVYNAYNR